MSLTPFHWFTRLLLALALLWAFFMAMRLGVTFAGLLVLVAAALWAINRSGQTPEGEDADDEPDKPDDPAPPAGPDGPFG